MECQPEKGNPHVRMIDCHELPPRCGSGMVARCVVVSNMHGLQEELPALPGADVLVLCGSLLRISSAADASSMAKLAALNRWLGSHGDDIPERVVVAGCHDGACEELGPDKVRQLLTNAVYLHDEHHALQCGLLVFGSPRSIQQSEHSANHAFQEPGFEDLPEAILNAIPEGLDLLVTDGFPSGTTAEHGGSRRLLECVRSIRPTAHVYGGPCDAFGAKMLGKGGRAADKSVMLVNCCTTDTLYAVVNPPVVLDIPIRRID